MIAHELAHIKNRDTLTMTVAATVAGAISMLAQFGFLFGGSGDRERNPLGPLGVLLAVIFAPMAAMLIQMTISRTREYSADRDGARISGNPLGLASALRKIAAYAHEITMPSAERNPTSAPLFIINPAPRRPDGQPLLHPPEDREPHPRPRGAGRRDAGAGRASPAATARPRSPAPGAPSSDGRVTGR